MLPPIPVRLKGVRKHLFIFFDDLFDISDLKVNFRVLFQVWTHRLKEERHAKWDEYNMAIGF
jgi:hypothetical protein